MTLLQITNQVLRRLREDTVNALSSTSYARLVGEFVADIHQEVALEHDWSSGYKDVVFDCVADQDTYDLSDTVAGSGDVVSGGNVANSLYCEPQARFMPYVYNTSSSTEPKAHIALVSEDFINSRYNEDQDHDNVPCYVSLKAKADGSGLEARVYPIPDDTYRIVLPMWIAESELSTDGSDDNTNINIPARPIRMGAIYLALNERGEEIGEPGNVAEKRYQQALAESILSDSKAGQLTDRYEWYRD